MRRAGCWKLGRYRKDIHARRRLRVALWTGRRCATGCTATRLSERTGERCSPQAARIVQASLLVIPARLLIQQFLSVPIASRSSPSRDERPPSVLSTAPNYCATSYRKSCLAIPMLGEREASPISVPDAPLAYHRADAPVRHARCGIHLARALAHPGRQHWAGRRCSAAREVGGTPGQTQSLSLPRQPPGRLKPPLSKAETRLEITPATLIDKPSNEVTLRHRSARRLALMPRPTSHPGGWRLLN